VENLFTEDSAKSDTSANSKYFDLSAPFNTQGAYPSEFVKSKNEKSRTASPSIKSSYVYKVKAESGNKVVWGDVGNQTFLIKNLELDIEWTITLWVEDPSLPESDRIIMSDSVKKTFHDDDLVIDHIFVLKPVVTKGEGSIELKFKFSHTGSDDSIKVSKVGIVCEDNKKWPYDSEYIIDVTSSSAELNISSVPAGNYSLWFKFYNSENVILYYENQSVNVFKNMATNTWRNNSSVLSGAVNSDGEFSVSDTLIKQNTNEHIYVGETGLGNTKSDSNAGTPYSPYENLDKAIKYIKATGSNTKNYQINISGTQNGYYSFSGDELAGKAASIVLQKSPHQKENAILNAAGTKHRVLTINGAPPITIKGITIKGGESAEDDDSDAGCGGGIYIVNSELTLDEDTRVEGNNALYHGGGIFAADATVNVKSNVFVYDNNEASESGIFNSNLYLDSDAIIKVIGPLKKSVNGKVLDAKIGITSGLAPEPGKPVVITSGYGYNSGKNSGISPGRYFIGDAYGLTYNTEGEAVLAISGGSISVEDFYDDIQISIDKTYVMKTDSSKVFTLSANAKDSEGNEVTLSVGSGVGEVTFNSVTIKYHGEDVPAEGYYSLNSDKTKITFLDNLPAGNYTINVTAIYNEKTYSASFDVNLIGVVKAENITESEYTLIKEISVNNANGLNKISELTAAGKDFAGKTITLEGNIEVDSSFTAIETFKGTFDGDGNTISGLNGQPALFKKLDGNGVIKNLTVEGSSTSAGIVSVLANGTIENCVSEVTVNASGNSGGIISVFSSSGGKILNCVNKGSVTTSGSSAGGIAGYFNGSTTCLIENCINKGLVTAGSYYSGGIIGYLQNGSSAIVRNCKNVAEIKGSCVGGIVGALIGNPKVENCCNLGIIQGCAGIIYCIDARAANFNNNCNSGSATYGLFGKMGNYPEKIKAENNYTLSTVVTKAWSLEKDSGAAIDLNAITETQIKAYSANETNSVISSLNSWASSHNYASWKKNAAGNPELDLGDLDNY